MADNRLYLVCTVCPDRPKRFLGKCYAGQWSDIERRDDTEFGRELNEFLQEHSHGCHRYFELEYESD